jgi:Rieske 2Fe-2S family protein
MSRHPDQPLLDHCPPTLPREAYLSPEWHAREMATLWSRQWVCAGRVDDFAPGTMTRVQVGPADVILCRTAEGEVAAFHNTCRHRGSVLCRAEQEKIGKLIVCPYHAWSYAAASGRLVSVAFAHPTDDFRREDHGLLPVTHHIWGGWIFLTLTDTPGPIWSDIPLATLDNWPLAGLQTGQRWEKEIACNWKVFWENYSECLHCPGIHP